VVGAGGIFDVGQARQMLDAGAAAVQLDAVLWRDPGRLRSISDALRGDSTTEA
jgi:dihydroorotate dehydrogenase